MSGNISPGVEYVCGFAFDAVDHPFNRVLLIHKKRPDFQAGLLNGIGGKIKPGESAAQAMIREFEQETGMMLENWIYFCKLRVIDEWTVHFFFTQANINAAATKTDEEIEACYVTSILNRWDMMPDLRWLVPMALRMKEEPCHYLEVIRIGADVNKAVCT